MARGKGIGGVRVLRKGMNGQVSPGYRYPAKHQGVRRWVFIPIVLATALTVGACADTDDFIIPTYQTTPDDLRQTEIQTPNIFAQPDRGTRTLTPAELRHAIAELEAARDGQSPPPRPETLPPVGQTVDGAPSAERTSTEPIDLTP